MTIAKLPLAKDVADFDFAETGINETLVRDLAGGDFIAHERNVVVIGGTGTGKTHLAIAIARAAIRNGARGRFFNVVDLVNKIEADPAPGGWDAWPTISAARTSSSSMNSAICPSPSQVVSCSST